MSAVLFVVVRWVDVRSDEGAGPGSGNGEGESMVSDSGSWCTKSKLRAEGIDLTNPCR